MTAKEVLNLIDWLRAEGFSDEKIIECIEAVRGSKQRMPGFASHSYV